MLKLLERGPFLEEERERARKIVREIKGFPYQLEVLERTYTGSSAAQESECFGFVFASCRSELCACFSWGFDLPCVVLVQRTRTQTR